MRRGHVLPAEPSSEPGPTFERGHCPVCSSRWQKRAADAQPRFRFPGYSRGEARLASALRGHHGGGGRPGLGPASRAQTKSGALRTLPAQASCLRGN